MFLFGFIANGGSLTDVDQSFASRKTHGIGCPDGQRTSHILTGCLAGENMKRLLSDTVVRDR